MIPQTVQVDVGHRQYPIVIADTIDPFILPNIIRYKRVLIVSNETIAPLYLQHWQSRLTQQGFDCASIVLPDGEQHKHLDSIMTVYTALLEQQYSRNSTVIALGGGVIGDMSGFAAATYQRGIDFVQIPTTLLACVDSSVCGKTGVNHPMGKNMVGAFYQPQCVLIEMAALDTLPEREYLAGLAEVIKYGCILDEVFFEWLEDNVARLLSKDSEALAYAIKRSCEIKADVVAQDEKELSGLRALLNFGHTFGHAIEACQQYKGLKHGEAVAVGMVIAADVSASLGKITAESAQRIKALIEAYGLPIALPEGINESQFWAAMRRDKKSDQGHIKYILLNALGDATLVNDVTDEHINETLQSYFE